MGAILPFARYVFSLGPLVSRCLGFGFHILQKNAREYRTGGVSGFLY